MFVPVTLSWKKRVRRALVAVIAAVASTTITHTAGSAAKPHYSGLFGSVETRSTDIRAFPKFRGAVRRSFLQIRSSATACGNGPERSCDLNRWKEFLGRLEGEDRLRQLDAVNRFINRFRYVSDSRNYGVMNYWATAAQLFSRGGDCEDYVVAKYISLRELGIPVSNLRVVVLKDTGRNLAHAVLVAYVDGAAWVLDNQNADIKRAEVISDYRPIYSINEASWWRHRVP